MWLEVTVLAHGAFLLLLADVLFQASSSSSVAEARWEEFRNHAVNQGAEWLRGCLEQMGAVKLRSLAVDGGIAAKRGDGWLTVTQLRSALTEALAPTEQAQSLCLDRGGYIFKQ